MGGSLHNIAGENGQALTILSVLRRSHPHGDESTEPPQTGAMRLRDAVRHLFHIAGEDGEALTVLSVLKPRTGVQRFMSEDRMPLRDVARRWYHIAGEDGEALTIVSVLEPAGTAGGEGSQGGAPHSPGDSGSAQQGAGDVDGAGESGGDGEEKPGLVASLIDFIRSLFHIAGEEGEALTVLSVLERNPDAQDVSVDDSLLRQGLRRLYHIAGERGEPFTILSVLMPRMAGDDGAVRSSEATT
jgi:hypothetical protein